MLDFTAHEELYSALFVVAGSPVLASDLDSWELSELGYTLEDVSAYEADLSPCEFDSIEEYNHFIKNYKAPQKISPDTEFVALVNYKGEGEALVIATEAHKYPEFVSKDASYQFFGI